MAHLQSFMLSSAPEPSMHFNSPCQANINSPCPSPCQAHDIHTPRQVHANSPGAHVNKALPSTCQQPMGTFQQPLPSMCQQPFPDTWGAKAYLEIAISHEAQTIAVTAERLCHGRDEGNRALKAGDVEVLGNFTLGILHSPSSTCSVCVC